MHEKSLVQSLLKQVEAIMREHHAISVQAVTVEIGPLSGVESLLVEDAFSELLLTSQIGRPSLNIQAVDLTIRCRDCKQESSSSGLALKCQLCGSNKVRITHGDEFRLIDVSLQVPAKSESSAT